MVRFFSIAVLSLLTQVSLAQYKSYQLTSKGDTVNKVDKQDRKQGKWIIRIEENLGEPGTQEEGAYKDDEKLGLWRIYNLMGDPMGEEQFLYGQKNGKQQYFDIHGSLVREENWRAITPDQAYDTIWVPDWNKDPTGNTNKKVIVKLEGNALRNGAFKYYDDRGRLVRSEVYKADRLEESTMISYDYKMGKTESKEILKYDVETGKPIAKAGFNKTKDNKEKPKQVAEFEKVKKGKKKKYQDGST